MTTAHDWRPYSDAEIKSAERCSKCGLCRNTITSGPDDPCFGAAAANAVAEVNARLAAMSRVKAERDAMHALLTDVMQSLRWTTEEDDIHDPHYEAKVESVCGGDAYGALMAAAQRCWRRMLARRGEFVGGEHVAGPARATVDRWLRTWDALEAGNTEGA